MPKNSVTDPITDQEITFAHLLLSGTMNDREAAEAAGLNPTTASYTKSKPRVREYMDRHRAAVNEKLIEQQAEGVRRLHFGREQILNRLWELANLSPAETKGSIAGQVKAMSMLLAVEGLLPGRRRSPDPEPPPSPAIKPNIYVSEAMRPRQQEAANPEESVTVVETPVPEHPPKPASDELPASQIQDNTSQADSDMYPKGLSWAPNAIGPGLEAYPTTTSPLRLPFAPARGRFGRGR